jgi:CheY-like chemotaxis protein
VPNVAAAMATLTASAPDVAILDLNLNGETSAPLADELEKRGVPFLFATGYGDSVTIPEPFGDVPVVRKPITIADLAKKVALVLARKPNGTG